MSYTSLPIQTASISVVANGDNTASIAAPGSNFRIRILSKTYQNRSDTDLVVIEKNGTTAMNGNGAFLKLQGANDPGGVHTYVAPDSNSGIPLSAGLGWILNLSAAKQVSGSVQYVIEEITGAA